MGLSHSTVTVGNFDIGPCQVLFNAVDLGGTLKNVAIKFKYEKSPLMADQFGKTILDMAVSGMDITVATELAETRDKAKFAAIFPSGLLAGTSPHQYIDFKDQTALRQLALAQVLVLHPLVDASSSLDNEWYFFKSLPLEDGTYTFGPATQASLHVTWRILLDTSVTPARMMRVGDHTL